MQAGSVFQVLFLKRHGVISDTTELLILGEEFIGSLYKKNILLILCFLFNLTVIYLEMCCSCKSKIC